jgi:hypothetical protein
MTNIAASADHLLTIGLAKPLPDLHDVVTHRQAWRDIIVKVRDDTNDDNGTGYYSHELAAFDRTFSALAEFVETVGLKEAATDLLMARQAEERTVGYRADLWERLAANLSEAS